MHIRRNLQRDLSCSYLNNKTWRTVTKYNWEYIVKLWIFSFLFLFFVGVVEKCGKSHAWHIEIINMQTIWIVIASCIYRLTWIRGFNHLTIPPHSHTLFILALTHSHNFNALPPIYFCHKKSRLHLSAFLKNCHFYQWQIYAKRDLSMVDAKL